MVAQPFATLDQTSGTRPARARTEQEQQPWVTPLLRMPGRSTRALAHADARAQEQRVVVRMVMTLNN